MRVKPRSGAIPSHKEQSAYHMDTQLLMSSCIRDQQLDDRVRVEEIEIVETYRDMAAEAAHELLILAERLNGDATAASVIAVAPRVRVLEGGRVNRPANPYASGWWRRIKINEGSLPGGDEQRSEGLEFTVLTDRAHGRLCAWHAAAGYRADASGGDPPNWVERTTLNGPVPVTGSARPAELYAGPRKRGTRCGRRGR